MEGVTLKEGRVEVATVIGVIGEVALRVEMKVESVISEGKSAWHDNS